MLFKSKGGQDAMSFDEILGQLKPEHKQVIETELAKRSTPAMSDEDKEKLDKFDEMKDELETTKNDLAKAREDLEAEKAKNVTKGKPSEEEVIKSLDPAVQEIFKSMKAQKEAAEAVAKAAREKQVHEEAVAKAKELKDLPADENILVDAIKKGIPDELFNILKEAAKVCAGSDIFKSAGSDVPGNTGSTSEAWNQIEAKAVELAKSKNISKGNAINEVIDQYPELYKTYLDGGAN